jgi:predicted DNA-binding transcriptional regulator AlpA
MRGYIIRDMGQRYLSITQIAERTGLARNTIKVYVQIGRLPPHDATIGRVKGWLPETIDTWWTQRGGIVKAENNGHPINDGDDPESARVVTVAAQDGRLTVTMHE